MINSVDNNLPCNEPLRVAQILNKMESGGVEAVVLNYYKSINKNAVQFDFFYEESSSFAQKQEVIELGAGTYPLPKYTCAIAYHKAVYNYMRSKKYKIAHVHLNTMSFFALFAAWRAGVPVRICHNHSTAHKGEGKKTLLKYLLRPFNKIFATHYFACSEHAGRWMYGRKCFDKSRVTVIPNAISCAAFAYDESARKALREELNIAQDAFVVGHVGRFVYPKNHMLLIEIFAAVLNKSPHARLLLIGDGELEQAVREKVFTAGLQHAVIFAGVRQNVNKLYSAMDAFALPSLYEGMPVVSWEAQANGLPCVFSSKISRESILGDNAAMLSIDGENAVEEWSAALACGKRQAPPAVPEISVNAQGLENLYLSKVRGSNHD